MDPESKLTVSVERLIALKRLEQPPPGYFHLLPGRILNRIEKGEGQSGFWEQWWPSFRVRPVMAYALGLAVCGVLTAGVYFTPRMDAGAGVREASSTDPWAVASVGELAPPETQSGGTRWLGSTNPVTAPQTGDTLFLTPEPRATPALFLEK